MLLSLTLSACASLGARQETADSIASAAGLTPTLVKAGSFQLKSYQRIADRGEVHVYIEGDGLAWLSRTRPSPNPTPTNPVALRLAAQDGARNVVYLARPCQYVPLKHCAPDYWRQKRYAPEVVAGYMQALDALGFENMHLIGYSGGGGIAALLAEGRTDVRSLRTVAGNVDTEAFSALHRVSPMQGSLNPAADASRLSALPQMHFIGGADEVVPAALFTRYQAQVGARCSTLHTVPQASHEDGWAERWTALLAQAPACGG